MSRRSIVGGLIAVIIALAVGFSYYISGLNVLPQSSYHLLDPFPAPTAATRLLVISPHEDDETVGAGGYLSQAVKTGAAIKVIFVTDGNKHGLKATRHAEALAALKIEGVPAADTIFYNYPDGDLSRQSSFEPRLKKDLDTFGPTVVLTTLPEDLHPDHARCGAVIKNIAAAEPGAFTTGFFLVHYHRYPRPIGDEARTSYLLPPPSLIANYDWQVAPLTVAEQNQKWLALQKYQSQLSLKNPVLRQLVLSFDQKNELFATLPSD